METSLRQLPILFPALRGFVQWRRCRLDRAALAALDAQTLRDIGAPFALQPALVKPWRRPAVHDLAQGLCDRR